MNVALGQARPTGCKFAGSETPAYIKLGENGAHSLAVYFVCIEADRYGGFIKDEYCS